MNRQIKFRVWDLKNAIWINSDEFFLDCRPNFQHNFYQEFEFQQFTGIRDKNNKDVYEGDILKVKSYDNWSDQIGFYYNSTVFYSEEEAAFKHGFNPKIGGRRFTKDAVTNEMDIEVVGNVFENPELLK